MAHWTKLPVTMLASHIGMPPFEVLATLLPIHLPANVSGR